MAIEDNDVQGSQENMSEKKGVLCGRQSLYTQADSKRQHSTQMLFDIYQLQCIFFDINTNMALELLGLLYVNYNIHICQTATHLKLLCFVEYFFSLSPQHKSKGSFKNNAVLSHGHIQVPMHVGIPKAVCFKVDQISLGLKYDAGFMDRGHCASLSSF